MAADDPTAEARVGSVLNDKWKLEKLLGVGGMGAVYAARHTRNGARAAVKILHPDLARFEEIRERFLREGRAANTVQHASVVKIIDDDRITSGPDAGTAYLVMELLDGESLEDRILRPPRVSEREFLDVADAVLDVLAAAHARGVVHRDLKPENLFLAKDPATGIARWKVLDFGLARLLDATVITSRGMALGTPAYMSPEQAAGKRDEIDGRTDLFALAATGFRVLTGRRIHEAESAVEVVLRMGSIPAPRVRDVAPKVSEGVARVLDRALAFRREDRYPDAAAMRADVLELKAALEGGAEAKTVVDVEAPTIVAPASRVDPPPRAEATIELSARDFEPGVGPLPAPKAAVPPSPSPPPVPRAPMPSAVPAGSASLPPPRRSRPSFIPVLTALVLAGIALKLGLDAESSKPTGGTTGAADASAPTELVPAPLEIDDAQTGPVLVSASVGAEDAGAGGDASRDARGEEEALAETDAGAESPDAANDAEGALEIEAVDAAPRSASELRPLPAPPPRVAPAGTARARGPMPPPRKPPHGKPHPRRD